MLLSRRCVIRVMAGTMAVAVLAPAEAATIVEDGRPRAAIALGNDPSRSAESAARLIQSTLKKISGAELPIVDEAEASQVAVPIYIGATASARGGSVTAEDLKPEEIVLIVTDRHVIVAGDDGDARRGQLDGTYFAAVELLHRLGVRWLWPGESGEVIPSSPTVALENITFRHVPVIQRRAMRLGGSQRGFGRRFVAAKFENEAAPSMGDWGRKMRLGQSREIRGGHAFGDWYEKYFNEHPDIFAKTEDGEFGWMNNTQRSKICYSNPKTLEFVVAEAQEFYRKHRDGGNACFGIGPTDGSAGWCMCPDCKAMDHPQGRFVESNIQKRSDDGAFQKRTIKHVSLTDRHAKFWNRVADCVAEECPGLNVGAYGYSVFRDPPLEVTLRPNVVIGYVAGSYVDELSRRTFLEGWNAWSEKCSQMYWRPNLMKSGEGFPLVWATKMGADIQTLASQSMIGVDLANCFGHWGTQGLNYYVAAQMVWDPSQNPGAIIDDYCRSGFGPAADRVRRYVARLEELTNQFALHEGRRSDKADAALRADEEPDDVIRTAQAGGASGWEVVWTDEVMTELERMLDEAAQAVASGTPEAARIAVLQDGLDFAKLELPARRALANYERRPAEKTAAALVTACARVEQWMHANTQSRGIAVIDGYAWWWRKMRVPPMRHSIYGSARSVGDGTDRVTIGAFSTEGRFVSVEFSDDGQSWTPPVPYRVDHEYSPNKGAETIFARLALKGAAGTTLSEPIAIRLN